MYSILDPKTPCQHPACRSSCRSHASDSLRTSLARDRVQFQHHEHQMPTNSLPNSQTSLYEDLMPPSRVGFLANMNHFLLGIRESFENFEMIPCKVFKKISSTNQDLPNRRWVQWLQKDQRWRDGVGYNDDSVLRDMEQLYINVFIYTYIHFCIHT